MRSGTLNPAASSCLFISEACHRDSDLIDDGAAHYEGHDEGSPQCRQPQVQWLQGRLVLLPLIVLQFIHIPGFRFAARHLPVRIVQYYDSIPSTNDLHVNVVSVVTKGWGTQLNYSAFCLPHPSTSSYILAVSFRLSP